MRATSLSILVLLAIGLGVCALAGEPPVNRSRFGGVAIEGYDPVAYFTEGKPVKGRKSFETEWNGATWRFASAEHRDAFEATPEAYAPRYGGYCAWAVSQGYTAGIDPEAWKIVDGKLYLNYSRKVQETWEQDLRGNIRLADENYPRLIDTE